MVKPLLLPLSMLLPLVLTACLATPPRAPAAQALQPPQAAAVDAELLGKWSRSCALCHVSGEAGAPVIGDSGDWQQRLAKGPDVVLGNVLNGYNAMPPLGYCMACEIPDFQAMIDYMAGVAE